MTEPTHEADQKAEHEAGAQAQAPSAEYDQEATQDQAVLGKPWMYKQLKIGRWKLPWFASPEVQLVLVSFVCFLCPGMFNAVSGLGGGGQVNKADVSDANTALYSCFAVVGFFAGSIANWIGLQLTLSIGGFGYFLYVASLLSYNHNQNVGFLIFAGALLGICGGLLWCAQGAVMMAYPHEKEKGKFISIFWVIFNLGGVIGSLVRRLRLLLLGSANVNRFLSDRTCTRRPARSMMAPTLPSWFSWRLVLSLRGHFRIRSTSSARTVLESL